MLHTARAVRPTWTVRTDVFDGPLDLLLYLVKRDGIDLRQVSLSSVCDSYLAFIEKLQDLHIAVASDYLVMAATLCHLKSLELLPRPPAILEDEGVDPREALARQLEAYEQIKEASEALDARPRVGRDVAVREPVDVGELQRPLVPGTDAFGLLDAYYELLTRPEPRPAVHTIHRPEVRLDDCCRHILESLGGPGGTGELRAILRACERRSERVITFIAALELIRLGYIAHRQDGHLAVVHLTSLVPADADLSVVRADVEQADDAEAGSA
ncbi:MAG: segregation and condensation protein A [Myxococcota bacterium]